MEERSTVLDVSPHWTLYLPRRTLELRSERMSVPGSMIISEEIKLISVEVIFPNNLNHY
jgi:hypothetical protein